VAVMVVRVVEDGGGNWLWWLEWWRKFVRVVESWLEERKKLRE
jgi:hypothetical protein